MFQTDYRNSSNISTNKNYSFIFFQTNIWSDKQ